MTPHVRQILRKVADEFGIEPSQMLTKDRKPKMVLARIEAARRLDALGPIYTTARIGEILNRERTTIVFYLARGKKKPSSLLKTQALRWRKPVIRHLHCQGCYRCYFPVAPPKVKKPPKPIIYYLQPYAGADPREYKWKERRREDHQPPQAQQANHLGNGG